MARSSKSKSYKRGNKQPHTNGGSKPSNKPQSSRICDSGNDFGWYTKGNSLTESAANFFLVQPQGVPLGTQRNNGTNLSEPGIMVLKMKPAINPTGIDESHAVISGINVGAREFYAEIRKHNAGAKGVYSASDTMLYMIAVENCYAFLQSAQRAYGYLDKYPSENRFYSKRVVEALGWDYDDIISQRVQFFTWINTSIERMKRFVIPNGYSSLKRSLWMNSNIWVDNPSSIKSAIYIPRYTSYFIFNSTDASQGGAVTLTDVPNKMTLAQAKAFFENLFAPINGDDDFITLTGDIMKAFGDDIYKMDTIPQDYTISPLYDMHALEQVLNMTLIQDLNVSTNDNVAGFSAIMPSWMVNDLTELGTTASIVQQNDVLYYNPFCRGDKSHNILQVNSGFNDKVYINTPLPNPNAETIVEATRLTAKLNDAMYTDTFPYFSILTCGNEIVTDIELYYNDDERSVELFVALDEADIFDYINLISLRQFAYAPVGGIFIANDDMDTYGLTIDSYNLGYTDPQSFYNLNDVITLAMHTRK